MQEIEHSEFRDFYHTYYASGVDSWRECGARAKTRNILNLCKEVKFDKVLEWGAGEGSILEKISKTELGNVLYAAEISESGIIAIKKRNISKLKEVVSFDGYSTHYPDKYFDVVILTHVLEHVENPRVLLREIRRIAKHLLIEVPLDYSSTVDKSVNYFLDYGHINIYTPSLLKFLLKSEKFNILKESRNFIDPDVMMFDILKNKNKRPVFLWKAIVHVYLLFLKVKAAILPKKFKDEYCYNSITLLCET